MELLRTVKVEDEALYKVEDVFALLRVGSYRRQLDTLQAGDYDKNWNAVTLRGLLKIVFSSRSEVAGEVQDWVIANMLNGAGGLSMKAPEPQPTPVVVHVQAPVHVPAKHTPVTKQTTLAIDPRTEVMLDVLKPYRPRGVAEAREAIARCIGKYDMPEQAWINYQYDQVAGLMTEESLMNISDFLSLKADRDPNVNWEAERIKL